MKKLVRVSLFVLMALTLSLAIGCKNDSDPEPAKEGSRTPFVGTWVDNTGDVTCTINADGTFVAEADKKYEGKYHVSPDGKTVTATVTVEGKEETFTLTLESEDSLELTLPESLGGEKGKLTKKVEDDSDPEQKPASSNFVGEWKSTDGSTTVTVTSDGGFTTEVTGMPDSFSGTYTVSSDGKTLTTSEITLPEGMGKVAFSMKLKDSETDVMDLPLSEIGMGDLVLVKVSTTKPNLDGTWTGQVVIDEEGTLGDATIVFANDTATLTLAGQDFTATVTQNGNFFTMTREDNQKELTGLISASGKAWLLDGSVFTKQQ